MLKLYYAPETCALAAHIVLEDAGAQYEARRLDFTRNEQRDPQFLAINPKGRVPALVCDEGLLTESPAILAYIAQTHPHAALAPLENAFAFAKVQAFNNFIASTLHVAHAHGKRGERWADDAACIEEMRRKMPQAVLQSFALIENDMFKGPFVFGDHYTICDPYLFTFSQWMEVDEVDPDALPRLRDHRAMMRDRPNVQKIIATERSAG